MKSSRLVTIVSRKFCLKEFGIRDKFLDAINIKRKTIKPADIENIISCQLINMFFIKTLLLIFEISSKMFTNSNFMRPSF